MLVARWTVMALLLAAAVAFGFYAGTGDRRYLRWGWTILKWTLLAAFGFFAVLIVERVG